MQLISRCGVTEFVVMAATCREARRGGGGREDRAGRAPDRRGRQLQTCVCVRVRV